MLLLSAVQQLCFSCIPKQRRMKKSKTRDTRQTRKKKSCRAHFGSIHRVLNFILPANPHLVCHCRSARPLSLFFSVDESSVVTRLASFLLVDV